MNTTMTLFLRFDPAMYTSPVPYVCASRCSRPHPYVHIVAVFSFLHPGRCTYVYMLRARLYYDTYAPLHRPVCAYTFATRMTTLRMLRPGGCRLLGRIRSHFLACEDVAGGSQQSGGNIFFVKYGGPSDGFPLSGGGIIILHVIRRHFLAAAVDPAVSLSMYSILPMEFSR